VSSPSLDFAVIGAAKAGTTALFSLLRTHPELYLPESKELPYFAVPRHDYYSSAAEFYADAFGRRGEGLRCGTVTPQYLYGALLGPPPDDEPPGRSETIVPRRIHDAYPDVRLIAVLRDPVARARSYHRMSRMRGHEHRPFDLAIEQLLEPSALAESRARPKVNNSYVVLGEYARLLEGYLDVFDRDRLLVLFHDDLERDPAAVCERAFAFLGVDPGFRPPNLGHRYNEGASSRRFAWLDPTRWQQAAARSAALRGLWQRVPRALRRRILNGFKLATWRVFLWNRAPADGVVEGDPSPRVLARLREHYREDQARLAALLGGDPPWAGG
jgi:hypothetical protein